MNSDKIENDSSGEDRKLENTEDKASNFDTNSPAENLLTNSRANLFSKSLIENLNISENDSPQKQNATETEDPLEDNLDNDSLTYEEIKSRIDELQNKLQQKSVLFSNLESKLEFINMADENFLAWKQKKLDSFATKFVKKLNEAKIRLDKDELLVREWIKNDLELDLNFVKSARNWFVKRFLLALLVVGIATLFTYFIDRVNTIEYSNLLAFLGISVIEIYTFLWFFYLSYIVNLITSYSRKWSRHRRELDIISIKTTNFIQALEKIKDARERIDSLHPQVIQYLQVLSAGIHSPWKVSVDMNAFESSELRMESFPEGVDIAAPDLANNHAQIQTLIEKAVARLFKNKGWREQAFNELISKIAISNGVGMSIADLDRDNRRNGLKSLYLKIHNESINGINDLLQQLAREKIREIVPIVQGIIQSEIKDNDYLKVASIKADPLADLKLGEDLIDEPKDQIGWRNYLQILSGPSVAWSPLVFSNHGILNGRQEKVNRSFLLGDENFNESLPSEDVVFISSSVKSTRPVDLLLRVDLSDWCSAGEVKIFEGMPVSEIEEKLETKFEQNGISTEGTAI